MILNPGSLTKKKSYLKVGLIAFVLILLIAGSIFIIKGPAIVKGMAQASLQRSLLPFGIKQVEIDSINFGWGRLYLRDIHSKASATEPSLSIQEMDIALSPLLKVKAMDVIGATFELNQADRIIFTKEDLKAKLAHFIKTVGKIKQLKMPTIAMRDCLLIIPSSHGQLKLPVHATTETTVSRNQIFTIDWGEYGDKSFSGQFVLDSGRKGITIDIHMANIDIKTPQFLLKASEISLWGTKVQDADEGYKVDGFAKLEHLVLKDYGSLKQPLEINLEGEGTPESLVLDELTFATLGKENNLFEMEGSLKPYQGSGQVILTTQISQLSKLWDFTPILATHAEDKVFVGGRLNLTSEMNWDKGEMKNSVLALDIKEGAISRDGLSIEGANSHFVFTSLNPLNTKEGQTILAKKLSVSDIDLKNVVFQCLFDKDGIFQINKFNAETLGGSLVAHQFQRDNKGPKPAYHFETNFKNFELAEILKYADLSTLSGRAKLAGSASMRYSLDSGLDILQAELHSISDAGFLQYKPGTGKNENELFNQKEANMAFQVLDNLNFSVFNVRLIQDEKNPNELQGIVKMLGSNPNVLNGYPFEFNIVTTGKLKDLILNTIKHMGPPGNLNELNQAIKATREAKALEKAREIADGKNPEVDKPTETIKTEEIRGTESVKLPKIAHKANSGKKAKKAKILKGRKMLKGARKIKDIKRMKTVKQENRKSIDG